MSDIIDINVAPTIEKVEIIVTENLTTVNINTIQESGDSNAVKLTTNQTIEGVKTFVESPIVPTATLPTQAVNLGQLNNNAIPYTGTTQPITGDLEFGESTGMYFDNGDYRKDISFGSQDEGVVIGSSDNLNNFYGKIQVAPSVVLISSTDPNSKGLSASQDFSPNITDLDYPQKIYVDNAISDSVSGVELQSNKNQNNGYCGLDSGGKVPVANLPTTLLKYQGVWNATTNTPTLTNPDTTKIGNVYNVSVAGTRFGITWGLGDWLIYNASGVPEKPDNSDYVVSLNGKTGVVTITKSDIGLSNVDNTSDVNKPVSTAQQTALNLKANLANPSFTGSVVVPNATAPNEAVNLSQLASENNVYISKEFVDVNNTEINGTSVGGGTGVLNNTNVTTNNIGVVRLSSSTTANSGYAWRTVANTIVLKGGEVFTEIFNPLNFTNTTNRMGIHDSTSSAVPANGVFFRYSGDGLLTLVTADNSVQTTSATIATLSLNTWYKVRFTVNANATSVLGELFNASGTLIASTSPQTTNIPTTARRLNLCSITTNSGTTATALLDVDFMSLKTTLTR